MNWKIEKVNFIPIDKRTEMDKLVIREMAKNEWLNGFVDIQEGDLFAGLENWDMIKRISKVDNIKDLWQNLNTYQQTFKFMNFYFANHLAYGCFVYIVKNGKAKQFEHLTINSMGFHKFEEFVKRIIDIDKRTRTFEEFYNTYFGNLKIKISLREALEKLIKKELVGLNWNNIKFEISNNGIISFYGLDEYQEKELKKWFGIENE
jgi:hypothetical protein